MALQSSGAISLSDVQTEHGGSNPISISEYYDADTGVPASGTISLSDFYGTSSFSPAINTTGLYIYYDMRYSYSGSGSTITDMSGNGRNGTLTGSPTYSGSNSFVFDGSSGKYITTSSTGSSFWNGNWTASFWVKFDTIGTSSSASFGYALLQQGTFGTNSYISYEQRNSGLWLSSFNGSSESRVDEASTLSTNTLYYCTVSSTSSDSIKFWVNGSASTTGTLNRTSTNTEAVLFDNVQLGIPNNSFAGTFYAFHLYNRVLSDSEVLANYNAESGSW